MDRRQSRAAVLVRPIVGAVSIAAVVAVVSVAAALFRDSFADSVPVTVLSPRAGLVLNPDAKVSIYGVQVGKVDSIEELPDGRAAIHLAIDPAQVRIIPADVTVDIAALTVFGAKTIQLTPPHRPAEHPIQAGQIIDTERVMIEANTIFEQLVSMLRSIEPDKLAATLGAVATALNGRGEQFGQALSDLNSVLAVLNPRLPTLSAELAAAPVVLGAYADAAPELLSLTDSAVQIGHTVIERELDLDDLLISAIGLADVGNHVLTENRQPLTEVLHQLMPITELTNQYDRALSCGLGTVQRMANNAPLNVPGVEVLAGFFWGLDRYRYPGDLPKVAAAGGPQCTHLPDLPYQTAPPFVVTDIGANPWQYANPGIMLNAEGLKEALFGPLDGPPRNTAQIGQPG